MNDRITPEQQAEQELAEAQYNASNTQPLVQPTEEEKKNGWTAHALTDYLASRTAGQSINIDIHSMNRRLARRLDIQNCKYNPLRWRG